MKETINPAALSCHQLERVITACSQERKKRYPRRRGLPKYGNINKGLTSAERTRLLAGIHHPKARAACTLMAYTGLRIGEAVRVRLEDLHLDQAVLIVRTEKTHLQDIVYLHPKLVTFLKHWTTTHRKEIREHGGWVFWSGRCDRPHEQQHISDGWLRRVFRETTLELGMNLAYDHSTDNRTLYRLTPHSFRHGFGTSFYHASKDLEATRRALRHTSIKSVQHYLHATEEEIRTHMFAAFA